MVGDEYSSINVPIELYGFDDTSEFMLASVQELRGTFCSVSNVQNMFRPSTSIHPPSYEATDRRAPERRDGNLLCSPSLIQTFGISMVCRSAEKPSEFRRSEI